MGEISDTDRILTLVLRALLRGGNPKFSTIPVGDVPARTTPPTSGLVGKVTDSAPGPAPGAHPMTSATIRAKPAGLVLLVIVIGW